MFKKVREPISGFTHLAGAIAAIIGTIILIVYSISIGTPFHIISYAIFGLSLILLYTASSLYHLLKVSPKAIRILRKIDHMMIYVLIAGTYTPICLVALKGRLGLALLISIWSLAIIGMILKLVCFNVPRWLYTLFYLIMGWAALIAIYPLYKTIGTKGICLLAIGGLSYTLGAVIYATKWPLKEAKLFGFHEIFHIFVIMGSLFHYFLVLKYIV